jgi:hypothetical protein
MLTVPSSSESEFLWNQTPNARAFTTIWKPYGFLGLIIIASRRKPRLFVANRVFELPELKLLVDSVQASKFITLKKSVD